MNQLAAVALTTVHHGFVPTGQNGSAHVCRAAKVKIKRDIPVEEPERKSRRLRGQKAPSKELPLVYVPLHERKEEEIKLAQWAVNRKLFDADLYANVPAEQRKQILDYMATEEQGANG